MDKKELMQHQEAFSKALNILLSETAAFYFENPNVETAISRCHVQIDEATREPDPTDHAAVIRMLSRRLTLIGRLVMTIQEVESLLQEMPADPLEVTKNGDMCRVIGPDSADVIDPVKGPPIVARMRHQFVEWLILHDKVGLLQDDINKASEQSFALERAINNMEEKAQITPFEKALLVELQRQIRTLGFAQVGMAEVAHQIARTKSAAAEN